MKRNIRCALVAMFAIVCAMVQAQDSEKMVYPQAEWSKAGDILMHTPGQELFNGVIHPSAGLFEDYFDVDKAADEHVGYIEMLEKNGIRVHTVMEILQEVGIDSLRELASNVLVYDISSIPDEDATAMENYRQDVLQKMSRNDLVANRQQHRLRGTVYPESADEPIFHARPEHHHAPRSHHLQHELLAARTRDLHHRTLLQPPRTQAHPPHRGRRPT